MLVAWAAVLGGLVAYGGHVVGGLGSAPVATVIFEKWLYSILILSGAAAVLARAALVRGERLAWLLIGLGTIAWWCGDTYYVIALSGEGDARTLSVADVLYLAYYPGLYAGLVILMRRRLPRFHPSRWLDGLAAALIVAAAGATIILPSLLAERMEGSALAIATRLAYPMADLIAVGLVIGIISLTGWRADRSLALLVVGCLVTAVADGVYLLTVASGDYTAGGVLDFFWPLGIICLGLSAWQPMVTPGRGRPDGWRLVLLPGAVVLGAIALPLVDRYVVVPAVGAWMAAVALLVCALRAGLTLRENISQSTTDALTGLPNRVLFGDRVQQEVTRARRAGGRVAVMIIDLDRFKDVNDALGHHAGDVMLREIATRLRAGLRESDTVARLGGDEFAVLLPQAPDAEGLGRLATIVSEAIAVPIPVQDLLLDIESSIGIAVYPDHGDDASELLQRAEVAMYTAKADSTAFSIYGAVDDLNSAERLTLIGELRAAIERGELVLDYQPKVTLRTGETAGVEALVRWHHPERGLLMPAEFIPIVERTSLIGPLTLHVIERALAQSRIWEAEGRTLRVAVNISARNLSDEEFPAAVAALLERWRVDGSRLEMEITETALMNDLPRALRVLCALDGMGVALALDDFGVGYTSLNYLSSLPLSVLKIDKSFVLGMSSDPAAAMIVRSTIELARDLGLAVVAEGVETREDYEALRALGCTLGQGFHMARPMSPGDLSAWLDLRRRDGRSPRSSSGDHQGRRAIA